jgi:hypothetical protein
MTASRESLHTLRAVGVLTLRSSQCLNIFENWMSRSRILQLQKNVVHRKAILNFVRNPQGSLPFTVDEANPNGSQRQTECNTYRE